MPARFEFPAASGIASITSLVNQVGPAGRNGYILTDQDRIQGESELAFGVFDFSFHLKLQTDQRNTSYEVIFDSHLSGFDKFLFWTIADQIRIQFINAAGTGTNFTFPGVTAGQLYDGDTKEITVTCDRDGNASLYFGKKKVSEIDISSVATVDIGATNNNVWGVGRTTTGTGYIGTIYDLKAFNLLLDADDVAYLIDNGVREEWRHDSYADIINASTLNGGFETAGGGGADVFANWLEQVTGSSTINDETVTVNSGAHALRFDLDGSVSYVRARQEDVCVFGKQYEFRFFGRGDGVNDGSIQVGNATGGAVYGSTGNLGSSYEEYVFQFIDSDSVSSSIQISRGSSSEANSSIYIDDVTLRPIGCILDLDFSYGRHNHIPDRSSNRNHGTSVGAVPITDMTPTILDKSADTPTATMTVDMKEAPRVIWPDLNQATTIDITNIAIGIPVTVFFKDDGTGRALTFDANWRVIGSALPATTTANKWNVMIITALGSADTDILIQVIPEP